MLKIEDHFHQIFDDDEKLVVDVDDVQEHFDDVYVFDDVFLHSEMVFDVMMILVMMHEYYLVLLILKRKDDDEFKSKLKNLFFLIYHLMM